MVLLTWNKSEWEAQTGQPNDECTNECKKKPRQRNNTYNANVVGIAKKVATEAIASRADENRDEIVQSKSEVNHYKLKWKIA